MLTGQLHLLLGNSVDINSMSLDLRCTVTNINVDMKSKANMAMSHHTFFPNSEGQNCWYKRSLVKLHDL